MRFHYLVAKKRDGLATKTISNQLVFLHGLFSFAGKRGWVASNPVVPLADRVAGELERQFQRTAFKGDQDLVFAHPQTGSALDASKIRKRFVEALDRASLRRVRFHDLRHTFGTHCASSGVPLRTLQEWMGHKDAKTTEIYADYAPSPHEAELVERAFSAAAVPQAA